jgi:hypothetical protein
MGSFSTNGFKLVLKQWVEIPRGGTLRISYHGEWHEPRPVVTKTYTHGYKAFLARKGGQDFCSQVFVEVLPWKARELRRKAARAARKLRAATTA